MSRLPPAESGGDPLSQSAASAAQPDLGPSSQRTARLVLTVTLLALSVWILWDFLAALVWATVFAIATWPLYERFARTFPSRGKKAILAPVVFTLVIGLVFVVPLALIAVEVGREALRGVHFAETVERQGFSLPGWVDGLPVVGHSISTWWQANLTDAHSATAMLGRLDRSVLIEWTRSLGTQLLHRSTVLVFTLLTLFFLYRDGAALSSQSIGLANRVLGQTGERLGRQMVAAIRGTVNGLVLVGFGEGLLLGVAYALTGVPHPEIFGAVTGVLAMIPFGAPVVFAVAALFLLVQSNVVAAAILFGFGLAVVFVADHFIRPVLIGSSTRLPFLWVLLGILGGLEAFGLLGLFLGPAVMAVTISVWREWTAPGAPSR